ncbi:MAG TPA: ferritin-like domain-containing protein [Nannocystaceae bacterium]|nr:ferritin-like domain-containing protein [Nannocystaceae bacterium]
MPSKQPFLTDVKELRKRARQHMEGGAVTPGYGGDVEQAVALLNTALATELVCVLRYRYHAVMAAGIHSESVKNEFAEHANDEQDHALRLAERINQLGGKPDFNPEGLVSRSHSEYVEGNNLVEMIRENLVAERIAIESYREMVKFFAGHDPTTRKLLEEILEKEEEHANDMHDLLESHG